ncbi:MAG: hypothetical protein U1F44_00110 [Coriobacteriia bacterium]|nr:hypothetical protein [Coriobacteriia bacterium]
MKVQAGPRKACQYAIAILVEAAYVLVMAGLALLVAVIAEAILR